MYKCNECGSVFEKPHTTTEMHGLSDVPFESVCVCPDCEGTDYEQYKIKDSISRADVIRALIYAVRQINKHIENIGSAPCALTAAVDKLTALFRACVTDDVIGVSSDDIFRFITCQTDYECTSLLNTMTARLSDE